MFCSGDVIAGIDGWGTHILRLDSTSTKFGVPIQTYSSSLAPNVAIIKAQSLRKGTIFAGQSELLYWCSKRPEQWVPRGNRGDEVAGEWIAEGCIEARDEEKFVWVEGITAFGVPG